jgi:hypothetical protein
MGGHRNARYAAHRIHDKAARARLNIAFGADLLDIGEDAVAMSLSVVASVQCCIVISGSGEPVRTSFISHRPALRNGNSTATACALHASPMEAQSNHETSRRVMRRIPQGQIEGRTTSIELILGV